MPGQTTQLINESSTNGTISPSRAFWRDRQLSWNSHSVSQLATCGFDPGNSTSSLASHTGWTSPTSPETDSQVAGSRFGNMRLLAAQPLAGSVGRRLWESLAEYHSRGVAGFRVQLAQALEELDQVVDEARSEGFEIPGRNAMDNADCIIKRIYDDLPHPLQVYPMPDGEVAIDVTSGDGSSVLILCRSDGSTLCFVNINGNQRRAHYSSSDALPDGFMHEALEELQQEKIP